MFVVYDISCNKQKGMLVMNCVGLLLTRMQLWMSVLSVVNHPLRKAKNVHY
jgi:hypothetical protein